MLFLFPEPSVVPFNLTGDAISGTAVQVTWQIPDLEPGFKLRQYLVFYRELEHGGNYKTFNTSSANVTHATLQHLSFFTTYEVKVAAATSFIGYFSDPANVTTKEGGKNNYQGEMKGKPRYLSFIIKPVHLLGTG